MDLPMSTNICSDQRGHHSGNFTVSDTSLPLHHLWIHETKKNHHHVSNSDINGEEPEQQVLSPQQKAWQDLHDPVRPHTTNPKLSTPTRS